MSDSIIFCNTVSSSRSVFVSTLYNSSTCNSCVSSSAADPFAIRRNCANSFLSSFNGWTKEWTNSRTAEQTGCDFVDYLLNDYRSYRAKYYNLLSFLFSTNIVSISIYVRTDCVFPQKSKKLYIGG